VPFYILAPEYNFQKLSNSWINFCNRIKNCTVKT